MPLTCPRQQGSWTQSQHFAELTFATPEVDQAKTSITNLESELKKPGNSSSSVHKLPGNILPCSQIDLGDVHRLQIGFFLLHASVKILKSPFLTSAAGRYTWPGSLCKMQEEEWPAFLPNFLFDSLSPVRWSDKGRNLKPWPYLRTE